MIRVHSQLSDGKQEAFVLETDWCVFDFKYVYLAFAVTVTVMVVVRLRVEPGCMA